MPWAAIGTAVAGLGAAAWNYFSNREQNERNLEQWQRENNYNLPINQVSRLKQAGLNPSLMYKNGVDGLTSASSPEMQGNGQIDPLTASTIALNAAQADKAKAEAANITHSDERANELQPFTIANVEANTKVLGKQLSLMSAQEQDFIASAAFKDVQSKVASETLDDLKAQMQADTRMKNATADFTNEQYLQLCALFELKMQGMQLDNERIQSVINVNNAEAARLKKALDVMDSEIRLNDARTSLSNAQESAVISDSSVRRFLAPYQGVMLQLSAEYQFYLARQLRMHPSQSRVGKLVDDILNGVSGNNYK